MITDPVLNKALIIPGRRLNSLKSGHCFYVIEIFWNSKAKEEEPQVKFIDMLNLNTQKMHRMSYSVLKSGIEKGRLVCNWFDRGEDIGEIKY